MISHTMKWVSFYHSLRTFRDWAQAEFARDGASAFTSVEFNIQLRQMLPALQNECDAIELKASKTRVIDLDSKALIPMLCSVMNSELNGLMLSMVRELQERKFAFISADKEEFFEKDDLFGTDVRDFFGADASKEIKSAGNCIAADENTAAVFHLMRVAEFGLRKLAVMVKAKTKHDLDLADWGEIIKGIRKKIAELELRTRTKNREDKLIFYNSVLGDLNGFKHIWRNRVMHTRESYNATDALGVFGRVKDLMHQLATH